MPPTFQGFLNKACGPKCVSHWLLCFESFNSDSSYNKTKTLKQKLLLVFCVLRKLPTTEDRVFLVRLCFLLTELSQSALSMNECLVYVYLCACFNGHKTQ